MNEKRDINGHYIPEENPLNWHPKLTEEQIMHIIGEKGIPIPVDRYGSDADPEYCQALMEYGIEPGKKDTRGPRPIPPGGPRPIPPGGPRPIPPGGPNPIPPGGPRFGGGGLGSNDVNGFTDSRIINISDSNTSVPSNDNSEKKLTTQDVIDATLKELEKEEKNVIVKVRKKFRSFAPALLAIGMAALALSGLRLENKMVTQDIIVENIQKNLEYEINENISYEDAIKIVMSSINLGDYKKLIDGMEFNTNSWMAGVSKELGNEFNKEHKFAGDYPITGFSVVKESTNEVLGFIEDFDEKDLDSNLGEFVDPILKKANVNLSDVNIVLHFGRTTDSERTRLGWIDLMSVSEQNISNIIESSATYTGIIEDFNSEYITIDTKDGKVNIPIKNKDGNYVKNGDKVIGSDNKEYEISNFDIEEIKNIMTNSIEVNDGKKITFAVKDMNILAGLPMVLAALECIRKKKLNSHAEKNPYYKNVDIENLNEYIDNFKKSKSANKNILSYHIGSLLKEEDIQKIALKVYEGKTNTIISNIDDLYIDVRAGRIRVFNKSRADIGFIDVTDEITKYLNLENNFGEGYDPIAEYYFNTEEKGRGGR